MTFADWLRLVTSVLMLAVPFAVWWKWRKR